MGFDWRVMRDLLDYPADAVFAERLKVATVGSGARLLALQRPSGIWEGVEPCLTGLSL